jgi:hypothetical protein
VNLRWLANGEADLAEYKIYQDNIPIAAVDASEIFIPGMFEATTLHLDGKPAGHALQGGGPILTFTPTSSTSPHSRLSVGFQGPHIQSEFLAIHGELTPEDLKLVKTSEPELDIMIGRVIFRTCVLTMHLAQETG